MQQLTMELIYAEAPECLMMSWVMELWNGTISGWLWTCAILFSKPLPYCFDSSNTFGFSPKKSSLLSPLQMMSVAVIDDLTVEYTHAPHARPSMVYNGTASTIKYLLQPPVKPSCTRLGIIPTMVLT